MFLENKSCGLLVQRIEKYIKDNKDKEENRTPSEKETNFFEPEIALNDRGLNTESSKSTSEDF